ncbi:transcription antitermination factor NusB [Rhabdothermincola sediminis]|uniref:transcription antitermination factor NusB n=1 Tax=Rhabdothermincola sediminis TaxID=2751370 RepID=UPI001AA0A90A|nr:transcription antitermination factor NusB [Rhabdothermincola sediminis]
MVGRTGASPGVAARRLAVEALRRIEEGGAYANLLLPSLLERSDLDGRDRRFVTELVYGVTRMRRACDWLVDRFLARDPDPDARAWLRLGAYQLVFLGTPPHAAVAATVGAAPRKLRGLLNAVLRRVAGTPVSWPDDATRLSYPDWIVERLRADLRPERADAALAAMNQAATVTRRADGYVQDLASQWVAEAVEAAPGERVLDVAAAPGGKATAMARTGAFVVAVDSRFGRAALVARNATDLRLDRHALVAVADGRRPPFAGSPFDRILIDAPCSGLGTLRRRPDARWRIRPEQVQELAALQRQLVDAAVPLLRPGGLLVYSVCTLTRAETIGVDEHLRTAHPRLAALPPPGGPWVPHGRGSMVLPQAAGTDGMFLLRVRVPL